MKTCNIISIFWVLLFAVSSSCFASTENTDQNNSKSVNLLPIKNPMLSVGDIAPNIILKGKGGKKKLNNLRGKIVLVNFWASWCLPCRKTNPQLLNLYNNYKKANFTAAQGFEIFAISLDIKKRNWKKATIEDRLTYKNSTIDKKGWDSSYAFIYGISQLPSYFLLDAEGKILAINPSPNQVQNILQSKLK